ncbi:hypothetical protein A2303_03780 [Candidatus Falkowbacteria bacterium RIFOXYB2_FULL_47_14]|uniref:Uncharacterized protein n=1 Tax=Candidatus Falkowbacteria bacterium RIFOXYA2_FULL_47_19 TaxID=1797994 RepID=A0A1F5SHX7_9BACT|nr:MAG: hypothetical protein A2227_03325 [Candidatus Falkowbacteria bacterium RIFOXYA2_FULL_47_19]OGF37264.1 MAG: hypothetical protein A2468_06620 [Candidatus Falkowbacteria bacterium RIFOXYC2_FULL_46_15]OGF42516.1 MAG: hypothetical protein A2303_03780 [Candidatus Falkowbacteria bacterium RIFOXYB2_FULL_47_14]
MKRPIIILTIIIMTASNFWYLAASARMHELADTVALEIDDSADDKNKPIEGTAEDAVRRLFGPDINGYDPASEEYALMEQAENLNLGDLFVLDKLFDGHSLLEPGRTSLGDLIILDQIMNNGRLFEDNGPLGPGDLFVLDRLFRKDSKILNADGGALGDIFILDQLFN